MQLTSRSRSANGAVVPVALLMLVSCPWTGGHVLAQDRDCVAVLEWIDHLNAITEAQASLTVRETTLTREPDLGPEDLEAGLAALAAEREAVYTEFVQRPAPPTRRLRGPRSGSAGSWTRGWPQLTGAP